MFQQNVRYFVRNKHLPLLTLRLRHEFSKQLDTDSKQTTKINAEVVKYLENSTEYGDIKEHVPKFLLRKYKLAENVYLINKNTAKKIIAAIKNNLNDNAPVVEVNPGFGFLSKELLSYTKNHLYLYETSGHFIKYMKELQLQYPGRITYKEADFFGMWKLAFKDKMDGGQRLKQMLGDLSTDNIDRVLQIIGSTSGLSFIKHLIYNIVFFSTTNQLGRPDVYITIPRYHYEFFTENDMQQGSLKLMPALFQLFFDYKILADVPKVHFLPWTYPPETKRVSMMDDYCFYVVNVTQKKELPCSAEYLPLLWYFFKPRTTPKSTRIIPMLEQWIPGCGIWLITGQDPPDTNKLLSPGKDDAPLPHMNIFTEFGDLSLKQKLTVFKRFISWPEFEQCPFKETMLNNLPKMVSADDDDKDIITGTHSEDSDQTDKQTKT